ncbi:MAG: ATP-binding protein [Deltaproteobacteria bacterium]
MAWRAGSALSPHVIRVDSQSRPGDVIASIEQSGATHAVVFQGAECRGVVSAREALNYAPQRPFGELLPPHPPAEISGDLPLDEAVRLLTDSDVDAAPVRDERGSYVGVVTLRSLLAALLAQKRAIAESETRLRTVLDELAHMGQISTMGEMASGIAHELNQPLAAIVAYVDALQELVEAGKMNNGQLMEVLRSVSNQAERAGQIIHRLRKMIKRCQPVRAPMSVNDAVREVARLLETEARQSGAAIHLELLDGLPAAAADFLLVQKVVHHLARNGIDAMSDVPRDQRQLTIRTNLAATGELVIGVCDQGHGLNGDAADRLFEPFFSTKSDGLGLGLSISRTIVEAHGGRIWITPNASRGVTARFTLPPGRGNVLHDAKTDRVHC